MSILAFASTQTRLPLPVAQEDLLTIYDPDADTLERRKNENLLKKELKANPTKIGIVVSPSHEMGSDPKPYPKWTGIEGKETQEETLQRPLIRSKSLTITSPYHSDESRMVLAAETTVLAKAPRKVQASVSRSAESLTRDLKQAHDRNAVLNRALEDADSIRALQAELIIELRK